MIICLKVNSTVLTWTLIFIELGKPLPVHIQNVYYTQLRKLNHKIVSHHIIHMSCTV